MRKKSRGTVLRRWRGELSARVAAMQEQAAQRHGSRKRALPVMAAGLAALAAMFVAVSQSVMAVNFTTANKEFDIYSNYLDAEYVAGFLSPSTKQGGSQVGTAELGIKTAKLAGMCAIAQESVGPLGTYSLMITAGDSVASSFNGTSIPAGVTTDGATGQLNGSSATNAIAANNLFMNSTALTGYGNKISGMNLGQSADTVKTGTIGDWPAGQAAPSAGGFGLTATRLNVAGLGGKSYGLNLAGDITLPKLKIKVVLGAKGQADCAAN